MLPPIHYPGHIPVAAADSMQSGPRPLMPHQRRLGADHHLAGGQHALQPHILGKVPHILILRAQHNVLRGADLGHFPAFQNADVVAQFQGLVQVVGDENDGLVQLALQVQQFVLHLPPNQRIQAAERFIHQQNVGVHHQSPGQPYPLLHPAGKLPGERVFPTAQAHQFQSLAGALVAFLFANPLDFQPPGGVVDDIAVRHQPVMLEHHGDFPPPEIHQLVVRHPGNLVPVNDNLAAGGLDEPEQAAHHRGLAAARKPHNHKGLALVHRKVHIPQADHIAQLALDDALVLVNVFRGQHPLRVAAKDLPYRFDRDIGLAAAVSGRRRQALAGVIALHRKPSA